MAIEIKNRAFGATATVIGSYDLKSVEYINDLEIDSIELNESLGWTGEGLENISLSPTLRKVVILFRKSTVNVSFLSELSHISHLYLGGNLKGLVNIGWLPELKVLRLENTQAKTFEIIGLESAASLRALSIAPSDEHIEQIGSLCNLRHIDIRQAEVDSLRFVEKIASLKSLSMRRCIALSSIEHLTSLNGLEQVVIEKCRRLKSISEMEFLQNLQWLSLDACGDFQSLQCLAPLPKLQVLTFVEDTNILDGNLDFMDNYSELIYVAFKNRHHYSRSSSIFNADLEAALRLKSKWTE